MTLSTTTVRATVQGSGITGPFSFSFKIFAATDLLVQKTSATGVVTGLNYPTDYTVPSGIGDASGGTVTVTVALAVGESLSILRAVPNTQPTSFRSLGTFFPASHEDEFDRLTMLVQQNADAISRSARIKSSIDPATVTMEVTPVTGQVLGWASPTLLTGLTLDANAVAIPGNGRTVSTLSAYLLNNAVANVRDFGALGNGVADDSAAFQAAIDSFLTSRVAHDYGATGTGTAGPVAAGCVYAPPGTYIVKNILLRSGIHIVGAGRGVTIVKLKDNTSPVGGATSLVGCVFTTTLDDTGNYTDPTFGAQTWTQGASSGGNIVDSTKNAGKYGTQTAFIATDISVESLTIDGNKANNGQIDGGGNSSVMGAGVAFLQTLRGTVRDCVIQNCRLDGVLMGYTLHGGSYDCRVIDTDLLNNVRCGVTMTTGYANRVIGCRFSGQGSSDIDIEANWNGEVNAKHVIANCTGDGVVQISSANSARSNDCAIIGGQFKALYPHVNVGAGSIVSGVAFEGDGTGAGINVQGSAPGVVTAYYPSGIPESAPFRIVGCTFRNFATLVDSQPAGGASMQVYNLVLHGNTFDSIASSGAVLVNLWRAYKCVITDNLFTNCGHVDGTSILIQILYQGVATFPNQGQNSITRNRISGANRLAKFIYVNDGGSPPGVNRGGLIQGNVGRQPATYVVIVNADTNYGLTIDNNDWMQSADETAVPLAGTVFVDATLAATMTRLIVTRNRISGFAIGIQGFRTTKCNFSQNTLRNVLLGIYTHASATGTFAGQGDNDVNHNDVRAAAASSTFGIQLDVGTTFTAGQTASSRVIGNAVAGFATANLRDTTVNGTYVYTTAQVAAS